MFLSSNSTQPSSPLCDDDDDMNIDILLLTTHNSSCVQLTRLSPQKSKKEIKKLSMEEVV